MKLNKPQREIRKVETKQIREICFTQYFFAFPPFDDMYLSIVAISCRINNGVLTVAVYVLPIYIFEKHAQRLRLGLCEKILKKKVDYTIL